MSTTFPLSIAQILAKTARERPNDPAVIDGEVQHTYTQLAGRALAFARALEQRGVCFGDRVAILSHNCGAFIEAYFAAAALGAILVPVNTRLSAREIAAILDDSESRILLVAAPLRGAAVKALGEGPNAVERMFVFGVPGDGDLEPSPVPERDYEETLRVDRAGFSPVDVDPDAAAHLYYTSGTTGRPKGVVLTHRNVCTHAAWAIDELSLSARDIWGHFAPMFHLADAWATFAITAVGGRHAMCGRFEGGAALALIEQHRITISNLIPTMLGMMLARDDVARFDLASLRAILSGGAPISKELVRRIVEKLGCDYIQTYGMTETSPYLTVSILKPHLEALSYEERLRIKSRTGRPFGAVELRVVGDDGCDVPRDDRTVGEIWVRGPTVTPGYWNNEEATRAAFSGGFLKTGDLAVVDGEGYVDIVDRKKDMILTGGENVYSIEVENVLYEHPAVLEAAAFGVPDPKWGEVVAAAVVLRKGASATGDELVAFARERLAGYKVPRNIRFLGELPKTGTGKISKRALRESINPER